MKLEYCKLGMKTGTSKILVLKKKKKKIWGRVNQTLDVSVEKTKEMTFDLNVID